MIQTGKRSFFHILRIFMHWFPCSVFLVQHDFVYVWSSKQKGLGKERRTVKD